LAGPLLKTGFSMRGFPNSGTFDRILPVMAAQLVSICVHIGMLLAKEGNADGRTMTHRAEFF